MTDDQRPKQATILVIDDDRIALDLIMLTFNATATVLTALNSENGLEIAVNEQPDLILLDTLIQDVDGHEICSQLKSMPETENIPVIILSNSNQIEDELAALDKGAIDFITKPIEAPILKARAANHLFQKRDRDQLKLMSSIDALTEVANRRRFDEFLHLEWRRAIRSKYPISLLMIDIDYFKSYNDTYGHQKGDECLRAVAGEIKHHLRRPSDMVARYGGEEFSVILPETPSYSASSLAKRIWSGIGNLNIEHTGSARVGHLTISIGAATTIPDENQSISQFIEISDKNLYKSKSEGRNRITA
ncbi:diguanylate cyclase [Rhodospirillales bacterium]|nr:diguanylate cyclase [Rhodospirillales bacterium]